MLNLQLRDEFKGDRLKGTTIDFSEKDTSALKRPAAEFLGITYPSVDLLRIFEATQPGQSRPVVLLGGRGQASLFSTAVISTGCSAVARTTRIPSRAGRVPMPRRVARAR